MPPPDFIVVGASRAGTTTLHALLSQHPGIFMPRKKEIQFFWRDALYRQGIESYERHFAPARQEQLKGEASPPYFHRNITLSSDGHYRWQPGDDPAARLARTYPHARIIISLRDPVKRAQSQFWKNLWQGKEEVEDFDAAVEAELAGRRNPEKHGLCWLYRNRYSTHVANWLEHFPRSQVLVLVFEDWVRDPVYACRDIETFLEIDAFDGYQPVSEKNRNAGRVVRHPLVAGIANLETRVPGLRRLGRMAATKSGYPAMSPETMHRLIEYFEPDVRQLEDLLERKIEAWTLG